LNQQEPANSKGENLFEPPAALENYAFWGVLGGQRSQKKSKVDNPEEDFQEREKECHERGRQSENRSEFAVMFFSQGRTGGAMRSTSRACKAQVRRLQTAGENTSGRSELKNQRVGYKEGRKGREHVTFSRQNRRKRGNYRPQTPNPLNPESAHPVLREKTMRPELYEWGTVGEKTQLEAVMKNREKRGKGRGAAISGKVNVGQKSKNPRSKSFQKEGKRLERKGWKSGVGTGQGRA